MTKKIVLTGLMMTLIAACAMAADAAAPAPKAGIELTQTASTETFNKDMAKSNIYTANGAADYSQTNIKAFVAFDMGNHITLTPWFQERFELAGNTGANQLDSMFLRNRTYAGVDATYSLSKAFTLVATAEYRGGAKLVNGTASSAINNVWEQRVTPYLVAKGTINNYYYSIQEDLPIYLDTTKGNDQENDLNNQFIELEGKYNLGTNIKLDEKNTLKIDLYDYLDINMPTAAQNDTYDVTSQKSTFNKMGNETRAKVILVAGDIKPFLGFLMSTTWQHNSKETGADKYKYEITNNIVGTTLGSDITVGNLIFNITADIGVDTAANKLANAQMDGYSREITNPLVSQISSSVKVKF